MRSLLPFELRLADAWPPSNWTGVRALVAVSGGADSVALMRAIVALAANEAAAASGRIVAAHFNHALRGAASDADERFVVELCDRLGIECRRGRTSRVANSSTGDRLSEEGAREERYEFLLAAARDAGARYVITAHTRDDQAETVLHRILRGTGIDGLRGIARQRPLADGLTLIRPMLDVTREEVLAYLEELHQPFRHDATNDLPDYTRNRIRLELMPMLAEQYNGQIVDSLSRLALLAGEAADLIDAQAADIGRRALLAESPTQLVFDLALLADLPEPLRRAVIRFAWNSAGWPAGGMSFAAWRQLSELASRRSPQTSIVVSGAVHACAINDQLRLDRSLQ